MSEKVKKNEGEEVSENKSEIQNIENLLYTPFFYWKNLGGEMKKNE